MSTQTFLVRTMSDTVETDIQRVHVIQSELLPRYDMKPLTFEQLRKIADGPFDLFLIPLIFATEYRQNPFILFNEARRQEIRDHALEIARKHGFDTNPPDLVPGIEASLRATREAGISNILMTTGGRRYKHEAMEEKGLGGCFEEIVDRDETYFTKEQGIYHLYRKHKLKELRIILLSGTTSYIKAGNNLERCKVGASHLEVCTVALSTDYSYNDEQTLLAARPQILIRRLEDLLPQLLDRGLITQSATVH